MWVDMRVFLGDMRVCLVGRRVGVRAGWWQRVLTVSCWGFQTGYHQLLHLMGGEVRVG